jgi:hypothetical protein
MFSILVLDLTMFSRSKKCFSSGPKIPLRGAWHPSLDFVSCFIETLGEGDDLKTSKVPILESPLLKFDVVEILLESIHEFINLE